MDTGIFGGDRYAIYAYAKYKVPDKSLFGLNDYIALYKDEKITINCSHVGDQHIDEKKIIIVVKRKIIIKRI
jgi:hypothetical protein